MKAKNTLQENNIPYTDINLDTFPQCREDVKTRTGRSTVPQIFFNATHVGGNEDLVNLVSKEQGSCSLFVIYITTLTQVSGITRYVLYRSIHGVILQDGLAMLLYFIAHAVILHNNIICQWIERNKFLNLANF